LSAYWSLSPAVMSQAASALVHETVRAWSLDRPRQLPAVSALSSR
jgi:hypothetical protein